MSESVISNLERAKQIADRIKRNKNALISIRGTLEIKRNALVYAQKRLRDAQEDVDRLSKEIPGLEKHTEQLTEWCAKNLPNEENVQLATELAKKIARLQKELEQKRKEIARLENGLPDIL